MPFEKVETQVDFPAQERAILDFWQRTNAFEKLRELQRGKPKWSFLDGPITANNPMGVHHAWGRTYKDAYQRYFAMTGHELRYQNGFDCQGLWVEVEVEKELRLGSKREIENLVPGDRFASIDRFVQLCKARVDKFARVQTEQSIRLGYWMDWDRTDTDWAKSADDRKSYFTMSEENNYTIWAFLKKCFERNLIYRGFDAMPWCPRCGVGLSEQEIKEGYKLVTHRSVFVKFPLRSPLSPVPRGEGSGVRGESATKQTGAPDHTVPLTPSPSPRSTGERGECLLVWTTTPWTLSSNVGAAVNPELTYLKVLHRDEIYYIGKIAFTADRSEGESTDEVEVDVDRPSGKKGAAPRLKTIEQLFKEKGKDAFEIIGEVTGAELVGLAYDGPFDDLPAQHHPMGYPPDVADSAKKAAWKGDKSARDAHRVVAWKEVGATTGTGIVHIAPGCGKEDFALGREQGLPPVAPLDDAGTFIPGFGWLEGKAAHEPATAEQIIEHLKQSGRLFASELYPHSYPHCWRCKTELLFRLVDEWFINMEWRGEIMDVTRQVTFLPESISGQARELKWLEQMRDWMISKKRFWGLALPIWVDPQTGDFEVIGSHEELKERAVEGWAEFDGHTPHRPWIDKVKIRNPKSGNLMSRIPDVGNPWLDAGIVPYSTMGYNHDRKHWEKWFPADFITESFPGQFRNWFYAILAMSTMMEHKPPFKVLLGHALVRDQHGDTMSKSKGNGIEFNGAANDGYELFHDREPKLGVEQQAKRDLPPGWIGVSEGEVVIEGQRKQVVKGQYPPIGADVIRWLYCRSNPAANINFGPGPANGLRASFLLKLWNTYGNFFCNYARADNFDPHAPQVPIAERPDIDRWILSDLQLLTKKAHEEFRAFNVQAFCLEAERFVDERLSNWYVRVNRRRFWKSEQGVDKMAAYQTLYTVLVTLTKLFAPVMPFVTETMYQNLVAKNAKGKVPESVHHTDYPLADESLIDEQLSVDMDALLRLVSLAHALRKKVNINVRQPLAELTLQPGNDADRRAVERFADQICDELNIKKVTLHDGQLLQYEVKGNPKTLGPKVGAHLKEVQAAIAGLDPAEVTRKVQAGEFIDVTLASGVVTLDVADVTVQVRAVEGWAGLADRGTELALDTRITEPLELEGLAREIIRQVQNARKDSGLEMEDRIELYLETTDEKLSKAIAAHRNYIAAETLTARWSEKTLGEGAFRREGKVDGKAILIELKKA